jgi:hypothetical protein
MVPDSDVTDQKILHRRVHLGHCARGVGQSQWIPDKALGVGCARWAVHTVHAFVDEFVDAVGSAADLRDMSMYDEQP